ncbi:RNA polymerase subunit sigma [Aphanothece hegewaldii CCALA 016]|uniref:RNA polymerase subunit sigma n=1 Tax=Aphanothece hegewaldii CCALA 016 TaxID=2107694 RepID=A0A2T1LYM9_9CHRO|nr:RNA polymerase sigma factor SigF [Aphanothece hegewaldii]PSF37503.1 RNA polymerase subunit sigma [Aphanothece hegewaldii CCALA 016]
MTTQSLGLHSMELLVTYSRNPSLKLRNHLVEINAGLVRQVAHRISRQCSEPYEDLEQIGYLGLIRAIERFNPHQGCAFSSFAIPYIRGEMLHYLRDRGSIMRIPRRWQELYAKGKKLKKQLGMSLGHPPKEKEVAKALGISLQEWSECQLALQNRLLVSLDATVAQVNEGCLTFGETLPDPHCLTQRYWEEERLHLQKAMSQLEDKTKAAIECVFIKDLPRKEAAKEIGISPMTVTRHLQKGIEQLGLLMNPQAA